MTPEASARTLEDEAEALEEHFESLERQREATRLGTWVFLASEVLLFGALFALYAAQRAHYPEGYVEGVRHAKVIVGSINALLLLVSGYLAASAVLALRADRRRFAAALTSGTCALGVAFLALKGWEWAMHVAAGALPGGNTAYFVEHPTPGLASYVTLYWIATVLHTIHLALGLGVMGFFALRLWQRRLTAVRAHRLELGALYWALVDCIWIVLWPLFYLMG